MLKLIVSLMSLDYMVCFVIICNWFLMFWVNIDGKNVDSGSVVFYDLLTCLKLMFLIRVKLVFDVNFSILKLRVVGWWWWLCNVSSVKSVMGRVLSSFLVNGI